MKGLIFDLQRCSLHDGPGIRTTVFFKGCPLKCIWCHNPESVSFKRQIMYDAGKCAGCMSCVKACPEGAHGEFDGMHTLRHELCQCCGLCVGACPGSALKLVGEEMDCDAILLEVERDMDYYRRSGGGLTLSGGEPMVQFDFAVELLEKARTRGIHTCIETSGFAAREKFEKITPLTDLFLYDYKETEPSRHKELTGVSNERILENLDLLYQSGCDIVLRCLLVPGVNDSPEHLAGIALLSKKYPRLLGVEIMAYHNMGRSKALKIGNSGRLAGVETVNEDIKRKWLEELKKLGCMNVKIG